jgi:hypothetical protein
MQILDDNSAQLIQGGHRKGTKDNIVPVRQLFNLGVQQLNLAINIIIGSGSISNVQANLLSIGNLL